MLRLGSNAFERGTVRISNSSPVRSGLLSGYLELNGRL